MVKTLFLIDAEAALLSKKERIFYFLLLVFFFTMYMPGITWLYNACMWPFVVYSFFMNPIAEKWKLLNQRKEIIIMALFFILNCLSALLSANQKEGISWAGLRLNLLILPLAIGTLYIKPALKERILFCFTFATITAAAGSLLWAIWRSVQYHDWSLLYNDNLSGILNLQSIYFAMLLNLTIFSLVYLRIKKSTLIRRNAVIPVLLFLFIVHFLLASRVAILILYSAVFFFAAIYLMRKKRFLEAVTLLLGLIACSFLLVMFFPKTMNRFKELAYTQFDYSSRGRESHFNGTFATDQWNGANLRIAVWQCAWTVIKDNMIWGTGLGDKRDELKKQYAKKGFEFGIKTNRNTHNNYLDIWMSLGLTGLIVFLVGFIILPLLRCIQSGDWYGMAIIIAFTVSLFSETYMDRTIGNTLLAFFISLIASYKKPTAFTSNY